LPLGWFVQVECQFNTRQITVERTKYDHLVTALPQEVVATVFDTIQTINDSFSTDQPNTTPYTSLKKTLIERFTLSESQRIETLLSGIEIGDKRPSEFFRSLKTLAGSDSSVPESLIVKLWMRKLPQMVQATLKANPKAEVSTLLTTADNVFEIFQNHDLPSISSVTSHPSTSKNDIDALKSQNQKLECEINELKRMITNLGRDRDRSRNRSRTRSTSRSNSNGLCFYHSRFGTNARKCKSPCSFNKGTSPN